jgi:hypothetical protein
MESKVVIREFDEDRDVKVVGKLERNCEIGTTKKGLSIIMSDPLSRIRFYPLRIMLVCNVTILISLLSSFYQILFQIHILSNVGDTYNYKLLDVLCMRL